jgi:hypothetical protein
MAGYYAYIIGDDDRIASRVDVICADDDEAKRLAKQLVDGHAVELWQEARMIERFEPLQQGRLSWRPLSLLYPRFAAGLFDKDLGAVRVLIIGGLSFALRLAFFRGHDDSPSVGVTIVGERSLAPGAITWHSSIKQERP